MTQDKAIIDEYCNYISSNHRKSSVKTYHWHLIKFNEYLFIHNKHLHNTKIVDIVQYIQSQKKWNAAITQQFLVIVKMFFKWYINTIPIGMSTEEVRQTLQRQREVNEIINYKLQRQPHIKSNKALSMEEVLMLLSEVKKLNEMDYNILYLFFYFGWRKGEFLKLNPIKNIMWKENKIHLTGDITKNYLDRDLYFNDYTRNILIEVLKAKGNINKLFFCEDPTSLNRLFAKYDNVVRRHIFPHSFRHTFSTLMQIHIRGKLKIDENVIIKILMGHTITDMTHHYTGSELIEIESKKAMLELHYLNCLL